MMEQNKELINAAPTKEFFISMLVKDIPLIKAIADLVDNCIDGAMRVRVNERLDGLWIKINLDKEFFEIIDNCGGFSVSIARNYAFRFGRPPQAKDTPHSVGRFGVGMKRSLFKLGDKFKISSKTSESSFLTEIDVKDWQHDPEWAFRFKYLDENETPQDGEAGTKIVVSNLHPEVAEQFELDSFVNNLRKELQNANEKFMERGLTITINGLTLDFNPSTILFSDKLKPAFLEKDFNGVKIIIYAGLGLPNPNEAGWYIYCNGRLIINADKTEVTGWGEGNPRYHNTFAMFRGYVFFDADNSSLLPWNTTKSGIDQDSKLYRAIKLDMIKMMRPVVDFLNKMKKEKDQGVEITEEIVNSAQSVEISAIRNLTLSSKFNFNSPAIITRIPDKQTIKYSKPKSQIEQVKKMLKVRTLTEVGEKTFDYFYKMECDD